MRSPSSVPADTVYLRHGEPMPLRVALESVFASTDDEFVAQCVSHYSGYVREAAIGRAVELGGSTFLALIVERLNDWVPEVRNAAARALTTLLATVPAACFVPLLPRLRGLMLATRADHRAWLFDFEEQLVRADGGTAIVEAISGADFHVRRSAYFIAIDHQLLPTLEIITSGLLSGDIVLARRAATLLDRLPAHERSQCVAMAAASPFGPVRHEVFRFIAGEHIAPDSEPFLWRCVFDAQGSLRSAAARRLVDGGRDVVGHCREMLGSDTLSSAQVRAALSLMVELRSSDVDSMLEKFSADSRAQIRAHALLLRSKVSPAIKDQIASQALFDPARKVRKAGVRLCSLGAFVSLEQIRTVLVMRQDRHAALAVCGRDQWDSLSCMAMIVELDVSSDRDERELSEALGRWLRNPVSLWTKPGIQHRDILLRPGVIARMLALADEKAVELRNRLHECGLDP
jgi:hypothetical protein